MPRTEPKLIVNEAGVYEARWYVRRHNEKVWKRRTKSLRTKCQRSAHEQFARLLAAAGHERARMTVAQAAERYMEGRAKPSGCERTQDFVLRPVLRALGRVAADAVDHDVAEDYARQRASGMYGHPDKPRRSVAPATIRRELSALQAALRFALKDSTIHLPKPSPGQRREVWMTEAEAGRVMKAIEAHEDLPLRLFVKMALLYGARRGAICDLECHQVDWDAGLIDFNRPGARQSRKRKPRVAIVDQIEPDLRARCEEIDFIGPVVGWGTEKRFKTFMTSLGLGHVTPHALKHTMVTLSLRAGVDVWDISGICATDPATLQRVYGHHDPKRSKQHVGAWMR